MSHDPMVRHDPMVKAELLAELGALAGEIVREEATAESLIEGPAPEPAPRWASASGDPQASSHPRVAVDGDVRRGLLAELQGLLVGQERGLLA